MLGGSVNLRLTFEDPPDFSPVAVSLTSPPAAYEGSSFSTSSRSRLHPRPGSGRAPRTKEWPKLA